MIFYYFLNVNINIVKSPNW